MPRLPSAFTLSLAPAFPAPLQVFQKLIDSGRLPRDHTDVTAFELDDEAYLDEVCNSMTKIRHRIKSPRFDGEATDFSICFFKRLF